MKYCGLFCTAVAIWASCVRIGGIWNIRLKGLIMPLSKTLPVNHLGVYKSWTTSFPLGTTLYKQKSTYTVLSAGTDFLVLKDKQGGGTVRVFRNTPESYEYSATPQVTERG
jgi:hypothetical protein